MQTIKKFCGLIKNCIHKCFRDEEDDYRERIIQLEQRMLQSKRKSNKHQDNIFQPRNSQPQQMSNTESPKKSTMQPMDGPTQVVDQKQPRLSTASVDSYFTINSASASASSQSVARRTFKRANSLKRSMHQTGDMNASKTSQFKQMLIDQTNEPELCLSRIQSQYDTLSDAMYEWNQSQYQRLSKNINFQLSSTQQLKLSSNIVLNQSVNKMQDFYTFYFNQLNNSFKKKGQQQQKYFSQYNGHNFRKYPEFKCLYNSEHENINASQTYMCCMLFQTNTSNALQFLKWYNSVMTQLKLFNFQKIKLVQNGTYPVFQIQQFGPDLKQKYTYLVYRQTEIVRFDNQPDNEYVIQLDSTFRKGKNFKSLIRFSDSQNGLVEIYCELSQKIGCNPQEYFKKKFQNLDRLLKDRLLKISTSRIYK